MTNEEMVMRTKNGKAKEYYIPALWERVQKFAAVKARDYYHSHHSLCNSAGVDLDDLKQEAYFAFLDAIRYYDPEKEYKFISYMVYPMLNTFNSMCGVRTQHDRKEPLNNAKRFETPVGEEGMTLGDMIEDEAAGKGLQSVDDLDYTKRLRSDLEECIDMLNPDQAYTIRERYFGGLNFQQIAERHSIAESLCRSRETEALRRLRRGINYAKLKKYQDDIISMYGYRSNYSRWRHSGCSSVEYVVLKREKVYENWAY